ncbi:MAG: PASTA domain-containing protein [Flavobacteriaceae bacterium]|nr:PASTA domain-containing protein [Flavobacteriaceae bacterium]
MGFFKFIFSKSFVKQLFISIVVVAILIFVLSKWLNIYTNHDQKIEVPNLEKKSLTEVKEILEELDLGFKVIDSASYNPKFPKKSIIEQNPKVGSFVKEKRKIYLTINPSGYRKVKIPNFYGKTKRQVSAHLQSIGLKISSKSQYVPDIAKDVVRGLLYKGKKVSKGDFIIKNETVTLMLGDGESNTRYLPE